MVKRLLAALLVTALTTFLIGKTGAGAAPDARSSIQFRDVTQRAGVRFVHNNGAFGKKYLPETMGPGVAFIDYDNDGWPDLLFSNDTQPNKLYRNNGNGTFSEKGVIAGVAFSEDGVARAGMGVDAADYDHSGYASLMITNFSNQMLSLYHNEGKGLFVDEAPQSAREQLQRSLVLVHGGMAQDVGPMALANHCLQLGSDEGETLNSVMDGVLKAMKV